MRRTLPLFAAILLCACIVKTGSTPSGTESPEVTTPDAAPDGEAPTDDGSGPAPRESTDTVPGPEHEGGVVANPSEEGAEGETPADGESEGEGEPEGDAPQ